MMKMDKKKFRQIAKKAYDSMEDTVNRYSLEQYIAIFEHFFSRYAEKRGEDHPPVGCGNIRRIMERMPYTGAKDESIGGRDMFDLHGGYVPGNDRSVFPNALFPRM